MKKSNYDKSPVVEVKGFEDKAWSGQLAISNEIKKRISTLSQKKTVIAVEFYPGVRENEVLQIFANACNPTLIINADNVSFDGDKITNMIKRNLTEDRVFGVLTCQRLIEFFDLSKIEEVRTQIEIIDQGIVLIYGIGASLIYVPDILIYADIARWEIQKRFRSKELSNWKIDNYDEDVLKKYKRGFFVEWRIADKHKKSLFEKIDYLLDTNKEKVPKMITGAAHLEGLKRTVNRPFRLVPFFDPGVWGGQWMKKVCDLDKDTENFAWCFDCVPEENSLYLKFGDIRIEIPSINLVFYQPQKLLGEKVHARFGTEFPIRFDFLDTIGGQNLSLQVHPLTEYIQEHFGMHYTQDESYYILDAYENACVFLGLKENIEGEAMINDLNRAQNGEISFRAEKYVNCFSAKKHDHFLIPAGTVHCSGSDSMVLEISATPYIFTFKLWDWDRVGLDGLPRPVHIEHGSKVIQWDRTTSWVEQNLINKVEVVASGEGWKEERTGLHEREFIETRRHWFTTKTIHNTNDGVNVLNLIEGDEAVIESPSGKFEPFVVHYAETFIIPASVGEYTIAPHGNSIGNEIATIKAYVRT